MCFLGHRSVACVQMMRWWSSNLRQWPLRNLGSVAILNTYSRPSFPTCLNRFCIVPGFLPHSPPPPTSSRSSSYHLSVTTAPHLLFRCGTPSIWMSPTPANRWPMLLISAPRFACLYLSPFLIRLPPSLLPLAWTQVPDSLRGFSYRGSLRLTCVPPLPPFVLWRFPESSGTWSL